MDITTAYWEVFDGQSAAEFTHLGYNDLKGEDVLVEIGDDIVEQVDEIRRRNGNSTVIKIYK